MRALEKAIELGKLFGAEVEAVSVFDPHYHTVAFKSLVGVLSREAGEKFKFKEQAQLHDEVIIAQRSARPPVPARRFGLGM